MISTIGLSIPALKKEPFSGSHKGMRYYLTASGDTLSAYVYPEPWCFEATPEDKKEKREFPFSEDGLKEAEAWLNQKYSEKQGFFHSVSQDKMRIFLNK